MIYSNYICIKKNRIIGNLGQIRDSEGLKMTQAGIVLSTSHYISADLYKASYDVICLCRFDMV